MDAKLHAKLKLVAEGFTAPIVLTSLADGSGRILIADQIGIVRVLNKDGSLAGEPFLDLRDKLTPLNAGFDERGLVGFALHPRFRNTGKFYAVYSAPKRDAAPQDWDHTMRLSEFRVAEDNAAQAILDSERVILEIDEPLFNHNCGRIAFGPDGYLYLGAGDGGAPNDVGIGHAPQGNGQALSTLLGKILRIDVNQGTPYAIPSDNPFADGEKGRPEIYAYGLRNPWGISFDRGGSRELFAADVGQESWEEVNIIVKGGNYGWRLREGLVCFDPENSKNPPDDCSKVGADGEPLIDPIITYKNSQKFRTDPESRGTCITGGYVYRGRALPHLAGKYVFGDWSRNWIRADGVLYVASRSESSPDGPWTMQPLALPDHPDGGVGAYVWAFGEDEEGELYVLSNTINGLSLQTGKVFKLLPME